MHRVDAILQPLVLRLLSRPYGKDVRACLLADDKIVPMTSPWRAKHYIKDCYTSICYNNSKTASGRFARGKK